MNGITKAEKHCEEQPSLGLNGPEYDYYNLLILRKNKEAKAFLRFNYHGQRKRDRIRLMSIGSIPPL
jgi:hypothetical protein